MSEILLSINPINGKLTSIQLIADDTESQLIGTKRLQSFISDITEMAEKLSRCADSLNALEITHGKIRKKIDLLIGQNPIERDEIEHGAELDFEEGSEEGSFRGVATVGE